MHNRYVLLILGWGFVLLAIVSISSSQTNQQGDIVTLVEQQRNAMPGMNSNGFVVPTTAEMDLMGNIIASVNSKNFDSVQLKASQFEYTLIRWFNIPTEETLYILKENIPVHRGWGTYILNPNGTLSCAIEAPHPIWDTKSWRLGIFAFLRLKAQWFCMAGAHRYANQDSSSDVAHSTRTIFYKAHQVIATDEAVQIHGFDRSDAVYNGYPEVVISSGILYPQNVLFTIKSAYEEQGFSAGVYSLSTQSSLSRLAATTNKEGQWSNANGKLFIHIEHDTPIRTDTAKTAKAVSALAHALLPPAGVQTTGHSLPAVQALFQNYPNPFNPETNILFRIEKFGMVRLNVYNILGEEIAILAHELLPPGNYTRTWNASHSRVPSGIYFLSLAAEQVNEVRKIMFIQ